MSDVMLLVGTTKGLFTYRSGPDRADWVMDGPLQPGWEISAIAAIHGQHRPRLLVGTTHYAYGATIRASDDLGKTWRQIEHGPSYAKDSGFKMERIWQIVSHPTRPQTIYAGCAEAGLFVSDDSGEHWRELDALTKHPTRAHWCPGAGGLCLHTIVVDHANPSRIWLGISAVGCFRSTDAGQTWTLCNQGLPSLATGSEDESVACCVHKIVQHPTKSDTLFMQYHGGVLRSDDGASSWRAIEHGLPGNFGFPMVITRRAELCITPLKSDEQRYFVDGKFAVYRSTDEGASWSASTDGLPAEPSFVGVLRDAMCSDDCDEPGVYLGTTMGQVYASRDAGRSWSRLPGELPRVLSVRTMRLPA